MVSAYEWLGRWEDIPAPGRHSRVVPVIGADGYPRVPPVGAGVNRAIPVDGTVGDRPKWANCPQARYWLEPEKKSRWERVKAWMRRPC